MKNYEHIKFDSELIGNNTCKITYTGLFFKNNSDSVSIVFGFDEDWKNSSEKIMEKTPDGFTTEISLLNLNTFNFCFRTSNYEWDNNYDQNYIFPITKSEHLEQQAQVEQQLEHSVKPDASIETVENIENVFSVTTDELLDFSVNPKNVTDFIDNYFDENKDEIINTEAISSILNMEESIVALNKSDVLTNEVNFSVNDKQLLLNNIISTSENTFSMNNLIDEILSPMMSSSIFENSKKSEEISVPVESDEQIDNQIAGILQDLYNVSAANKTKVDTISSEIIPEIVEEDIIVENINQETPVIIEEDIISQEEVSLLDEIKTENANIQVEEPVKQENALIVSPRALNKFYLFKKKVKIAFLKFFRFFPGSNEISTNLN